MLPGGNKLRLFDKLSSGRWGAGWVPLLLVGILPDFDRVVVFGWDGVYRRNLVGLLWSAFFWSSGTRVVALVSVLLLPDGLERGVRQLGLGVMASFEHSVLTFSCVAACAPAMRLSWVLMSL